MKPRSPISLLKKHVPKAHPSAASRFNSHLFFLLISLCVLMCPAITFSDTVNREEVLRKYQEAVDVAHAENVYQNDILKILPRIRNATKLLVQGEYEESSVLLDEILYDLKLVESQIPKQLHQ